MAQPTDPNIIAAADDLLEALSLLADVFEATLIAAQLPVDQSAALANARKAISKARGL